MKLKKITLENIRSYKQQEVIFPEGSILLSGDIGSGKTSVLLGIEFALFGLQPGQKGSSLLRNGSKEGRVRLEFEIDDKEIIIERTLKKGKTISQDSCSIAVDGEKREISVTELKSLILELLSYPREFAKKQNLLYKFTVYTPQEEMKQIILEDPETRINTLRHVFGIDKYKRILENTLIITAKLREERRVKEGLTMNLEQDKLEVFSKETELEEKHYNLSSIEKELFLKKEHRNKIQDEKEEISRKIEEKRRFQQEIEKTHLLISTKRDSLLENRRTINQLSDQMKELQSIKFNISEIFKTENELESIKREKERINEENLKVLTQINSFNIKNKEGDSLKDKISKIEICPTCLQDVDPVYKTNVLNKLDSDKAENLKKIQELNLEKVKIAHKLTEINSDISNKEKHLQELRILNVRMQGLEEKKKRVSDLEKSFSYLEKDVELLEKHTESLKGIIFDMSKFDNLFELKNKELEDAIKQERLADIKVAELKREIDVFNRQIEELKNKIKKIEKLKEQLNYLIELENWLSKKFTPVISFIERNVMTKLKTEFSKLFEEWFSMLVSENFNVRLDEDFTPIIEQQDYEIDYAYLSGGERTAVALAYRLALNQVLNSFLSKIKTKDLVILDEPTDGFSDQQLDKMRDVLLELNVGQLIIVSHEQKIESFVENVVRFRKEKGLSKVD